MQFTEEIGKEYLRLWQSVSVRSEKLAAVKEMAERMLSRKSRYEKVAVEFGCPWWWVGLIHAMESGCDFSTWLANGDSLKGPTIHVPRGLQCDGTWEDGARVSLKHHGMPPKDAWSLQWCFYEFERYNGFGYRQHNDVSDYLWSFTNHERAGRYVADGKWSPAAWSEQPSCGAMLKYLQQIGAITLDGVRSVDERVTWMEMHRLEENGNVRAGCVGYAGADALVTWDGTDKASLIQFLQRFPNAGTVQLAAAGKAWPTLKPKPEPSEVVVKCVRTGAEDAIGCEKLLVTFEGTPDFLYMRSGVPSRQVFRKADDLGCVPGSLEPIPQPPSKDQFYYIHDIDFAGAKDDYITSFSAALGPVKVWLENKFPMRRSEFLFHVDGGAPGSAGCLCVTSIDDLRRLVALLRKHNPRRLYIDWGL